jgi:N-methylhydantoinase A
MEAVDRALDAVAGKLGVDRDEAARGVVRIANNNMVNALKLISVNRGYDPRDFTLVAFGGGGGMHAVALAQELGIRKVVIPRAADVFSAWGMLMSDLRRDYFLTRLIDLTPENAGRIEGVFSELVAAALAQFGAEGIAPEQATFRAHGNLRYTNQEHGVEIALPEGASVQEIEASFHEAYEREYTYRLDTSVEFVGGHLIAVAEVGKLEPARLPVTGRPLDAASKGTRTVDFATEGIHEADIYDGDALEPGAVFDGPAVVESKGTTSVIHPGNSARVDDFGNLVITLA